MSGDQPNPPRLPESTSESGGASSFEQLAGTAALPRLKSPRTNPSLNHPQGPRSQSLDPTTTHTPVDPRDRPGSSRTKVVTLPSNDDTSLASPTAQRTPTSPTRAKTLPTTTTNIEAESSLPPYRSPEPVYEAPEEHPEGFIPGVVREHAADDFSTPPRSTPPASGYASPAEGNGDIDVSRWQADVKPGYDGPESAEMETIPDDIGPQLGPGMSARRALDHIHPHRLMRVSDISIPPRKATVATNTNQSPGVNQSPKATTRAPSLNPLSPTPTGSEPSSASSQPTGTLDYDHIRTEQDVSRALPGGIGGRDDWYYCWKCCVWQKVEIGGPDRLYASDGKICTAATDTTQDSNGNSRMAPDDVSKVSIFPVEVAERRLRDLEKAPEFGDASTRRHFHEPVTIIDTPSAATLERIDIGDDAVRFPHTIPGMEVDPNWLQRDRKHNPTRLYLSCGTKEFIRSESGPVPGQIPSALMKAFIQGKRANPNVGASPPESVTQALQLLST